MFQNKNNISSAQKRNEAKYALFRKESYDGEAGWGYPYDTTGDLKESFKRNMFYRASGYRMRRDASGFAANLAYRQAGTIPALIAGKFVLAIENATKKLIQFSKASVDAFASLETVKTKLEKSEKIQIQKEFP